MNSRMHYLGGFFDGEGCIQIPLQTQRDTFFLSVSCDNYVKAPIKMMHDEIGGSMTTWVSKSGKTVYRWYAYGEKAARALEKMAPYLVVKKRQAEIAIVFQDRRPGKTKLWQSKQHDKLMLARNK